MYRYKKIVFLLFLFLIVLFSCRSKVYFKKGVDFSNKKNWDKAVSFFIKALSYNPENVKYRLLLSKSLISASTYHLKKGNKYFAMRNLDQALFEYEKSMENNPENNLARRNKFKVIKILEKIKRETRIKTEIEKVKEDATKKELLLPESKISKYVFKVDFKSIELKHLFRVLERSTKVNFLFDQGFKSKKIHLKEEETTILELLDKITLQAKIFYKVIDENTILIIPDTPVKRKKYEDLVMKTFFLSNIVPDEIIKTIKNISGIKNISINKKLNSLTVKGKLKQVKLVEKLVELNDKPKGELLIDIEIIEVNKKRVKEYGIELSKYKITETYAPGAIDNNISSVARLTNLVHADAADFLLSLPSIHYKLLRSDRDSKIKARPHIRVIDGEDIEIRLGDKVPIPTTTFIPQYGGSTVNNQPITSYKMEDIGINIDLKPTIHHNGLISIKMNFELTFISSPGDIENGTPPTIGNRTIKTLIRLKDNETTILAGLLRDTERKTLRGFPFLSRIPILKSIFAGNSKEVEQTDIILTLTPRIIRFPEINEKDLEYTWVGTATDPGIKKTIPKFFEENVKSERKKDKSDLSKIDFLKKNKEQNSNVKIDKANIKQKKKKNKDSTSEIKEKLFIKFITSKTEIKENKEFSVSIFIKSVNLENAIKTIKAQLTFDKIHLAIAMIKKGEIFSQKDVKGNLFKTFDNINGKAGIKISFDKGMKKKEFKAISVTFRALVKGKTFISANNCMIFDSDMKEIPTVSEKKELIIY